MDHVHINLNRETVAHLMDFQAAMLPSSGPASSDWAADSAAMTASLFVPPPTEQQRFKVCVFLLQPLMVLNF